MREQSQIAIESKIYPSPVAVEPKRHLRLIALLLKFARQHDLHSYEELPTRIIGVAEARNYTIRGIPIRAICQFVPFPPSGREGYRVQFDVLGYRDC